jgi:hypothetical protein
VEQTIHIHQIDGLIDLQAEMQAQLIEQLALEAASMAIDAMSEDVEVGERIALQFAEMAFDAATESQEQVPILGDIPLLGTLFGESEGTFAFSSADELVRTAKLYMIPAFDPKTQGVKVENTGEKRVLVSFLKPDQQQWLTDFLQMQRGIDQWHAHMNVKVYLTPFRDATQNENAATVFNSIKEAEAMGKKLQEAGATLMSNPSLVTLPGQSGTIAVQRQSSYVSDWKLVKVQPSAEVVADPTIEVVSEGLVFDVHSVQTDADSYGIEIDLKMSRLEEPFGTKTIKLDGRKFEIGVPEVVTANIATTIKLPSGGGVMLRSPQYDEGHDLVLIFTFNRIDIEK